MRCKMAFDINETGRAAKDAAFSLQALSGDEKIRLYVLSRMLL